MRSLRAICVLVALSFLALAPAWAGHDDHGNGKREKAARDEHHRESKQDHHEARHARGGLDIDVNVVFASTERDLARIYFAENHGRGHCPPALAKKHNGCLPPGLAKKRYRVGHCVPSGVVIEALPRDLELRIGIPSPGYRYGLIDGDLVKLAVGSMLVVDAVQGLVN